MERQIIATTKYSTGDGYTIEFITGFNTPFKKIDKASVPKNDIQILFKNKKGLVLLSAISKFGSYGVEEGLWEIMPHYQPKDGDNSDSVLGHLTFSQVMEYIEEQRVLDSDREEAI
jgi:hypothetical protein